MGNVEKEDQLRVGEETDWKCGEGRSAESGRGDGQGDVEKEDQLRVGEGRTGRCGEGRSAESGQFRDGQTAMWRRKIS